MQTNAYVNLLAVISEHNGDVGANAICELYVGGELADYAYDVWVDAGDAVTCAFTWRFPAPGSYPVEVRVWPSPDDWEPADNADTATIQVTGGLQFDHSARFTQRADESHGLYLNTWRDSLSGQAGEYRSEYHNTSMQQSAYLSAFAQGQLSGPLNLRISMATGGRAVHSAEWNEPAREGDWCTDHADGPVMFWLCTGGGTLYGSTSLGYSRVAGTVTYHSQGYSRVWDTLTGTDQFFYHWNDALGWEDGTIEPLGDDWSFDVRLATPDGEVVIAPTLQLTREAPGVWSSPYTCRSAGMPEWGYTSTTCSESSSRTETISGY